MKRNVIYLLSFLFVLLVSILIAYKAYIAKSIPVTPIAEEKKEVVKDPITKIDELLENEARNNRFYGSVLIAKNGKILLEKGYGYANKEHKIKNNKDTKYRIASLTKSFIAASILILEQEGKLSTSDKLSYHLAKDPSLNKLAYKNFGKGYNQITIAHLLSHQTGIRNYFTNTSKAIDKTDLNQLLTQILSNKLNFIPGTKYQYSNSNYVILTYIIEQVSKQKINEYLKDNIFEKLEMHYTFFEDYKDIVYDRANGYEYVASTSDVKNADFIDLSQASGAGGLISTLDDLYKWDQALYTDKIINNDQKSKMFSPNLSKYGYGWRITDSIVRGNPHKLIWHNGYISGFASTFYRYVDDNLTMIFLRNIEGSPFDINNQIPTIYWGLEGLSAQENLLKSDEEKESAK